MADRTATHEQVDIAEHVRTADDKVFFPGKAHVTERDQAAIEAANENRARRVKHMAEEEDEEAANELGDTRTSTAEKKGSKKAASKKKGK